MDNLMFFYERMTVDNTALGDVNKDGTVTIADVTKLVNIILGKE